MSNVLAFKSEEPMSRTFHPISEKFRFPLLEGKEFEALVNDIRKHGLIEPIWIYQDQILDGRNRYNACLKVGQKPKEQQFTGTEAEACDFVISTNVLRRHLTHALKMEIVERLLREDPSRPSKQLERVTKVSDKTITKKRKQMEQLSEIPKSVPLRKQSGQRGSDKKPRKTKKTTTKTADKPSKMEVTERALKDLERNASLLTPQEKAKASKAMGLSNEPTLDQARKIYVTAIQKAKHESKSRALPFRTSDEIDELFAALNLKPGDIAPVKLVQEVKSIPLTAFTGRVKKGAAKK